MNSDEDNVPPLEDVTEMLEKLKSKSSTEKPPQKKTSSTTQKRQSPPAMSISKKQDQGGFGGFKKGFLNSGGSSKSSSTAKPASKKQSKQESSKNSSGKDSHLSTSDNKPTVEKPSKQEDTSSKDPHSASTSDDIPHIKKSKASGLELPEVQEAMKDTFPFLEKNDWVTKDLLSKVEKHPNLSRVFQDPNLTEILLEFQKDPQKAMAAAKDNKEMRGFLQDFCALMGDHFIELADQEDKMKAAAEKGTAPLITEVTEPSDEDKVKELLAKPEVQELLADKEVQKLLHLLKTNPEAAHKMSRSANPAFQERIRQLIQHGLLAMQP